MSHISLDHSFSSHSPGRKDFLGRNFHGKSERVILIDVDADPYENDEHVIFIDAPKSKKRRGPGNLRARNQRYLNVIYIDDDDDDDNGDDRHPVNAERVGTHSRVESFHVGDTSVGPSDVATGKAQFVQANVTPVRLSKCKRTYSANSSIGGLHGFNDVSGSIPNDFNFCDLDEDSSEITQGKWRKGFSQSTSADIGLSEFNNSSNNSSEHRVGEDQCLDVNKPFSNAESSGSQRGPPNFFSCDLNEVNEALATSVQVCDDAEPCEVGQGIVQKESGPLQSTGGVNEIHEANNFCENEHGKQASSFLISNQIMDSIQDLQIEPADALVSKEDYIFQDREKIKETDEYKMAMEEEWASRQATLQAQAQEAKQLKILAKRKKAETLRLLDMERRQKERLEEIRNSQKKEEETLNMRDAIRAEVQKGLSQVEIKCKNNMASLLHELGISVGGWPHPSPQQVLSAYKKALLTFHPDRASHLEIRLQVEAEEKFKLINRMKNGVLL